MANNDAPFGFKPWGVLKHVGLYAVPTAPTINFYHGDIVQGSNTFITCTNGQGTIPEVYDAAVIAATSGDTLPTYGAVVGILDENLLPVSYIAAGEVGDGTIAGYLLVADDPDQEFVAQSDGAITAANMDLNHEITSVALSAGNSNTGVSTQEIAASGSAVTATIPLRILRQAYPNEDAITSAGCRFVVKINPDCHYRADGLAI
ncbi:MAG: hypothetical protein WC455_17380 [Dehalococcoidia bacterium]|jgi:hypothetical protein